VLINMVYQKKNKKINRVTISVPKDIDLDFRKKAAIYFSFRRGWYGKAVLEAIKLWITHHSKPKENIPNETKNYLWNHFRNKINVDSDDPEEIIDSIVDYFRNVKYVGDITYKIDWSNIALKKKNSFESYIPNLLSFNGSSIFLNCPVESVADAALCELTGRKYNVIHSNILIYSLDEPRSLDREIQNQKTLSAYSNQSL
jgi:hypothetical protein